MKRRGRYGTSLIHTLATCEWVRKGQPLCLTGDSGTGKSHLLIALGTEAAMKGYRVKYTLATKLVNELVEAADDLQLNKTLASTAAVGNRAQVSYAAAKAGRQGFTKTLALELGKFGVTANAIAPWVHRDRDDRSHR